MTYLVYHYEAFAARPGEGNPAGVMLDTAGLTDTEMQFIAAQVGFNETTFVLPSAIADLRLRYFTPGHEINLCGHATVASLFALYERQLLPYSTLPQTLAIETKAGVLPIELHEQQGQLVITMTQAEAQFMPFKGDTEALAQALGITPDGFYGDLPIVYGSTGIWTLIVPVKNLQVIQSMRPHSARFPEVLTAMPRASIHPFCLKTIRPDAQFHGRHFSSPFSGTIEDPVTGTASGVMGAYMATYAPHFSRGCHYSFRIEQGHEVGRNGLVEVRVLNRHAPFKVQISGTGTYVREMAIASPALLPV